MKRLLWPVLVPAAALLLVAAGTWVWQNHAGRATAGLLQPSNPEIVAQGETLYREHCAECHGADLEGQADWQQRRSDGRLPAPPHDESGHTWHHPTAVLLKITKLGPAAMASDGYQSDMPGYDGVLSDAEILAILSFIKSSWPDAVRRQHDQIDERGMTH